MRRSTAVLAAGILALSLAFAPASSSAAASLPDIEDEVMCTICGTTLALSNSPQAERQRVFINDLIADGSDKEEIKAALVDEYGPEVLAVPSDDGFDLLGGWIFPAVALLIGAGLVGAAALRWRRNRVGEEPAPAVELTPGEASRLDKDLDRYDT